jgi:hypothetical protein
MGQATQELLIPFLGALQASVAVLLTILVGVIASQFQLIGIDSSKEISKVAVRLFLPALLIVNVGSQLHSDTVCSCSKNDCSLSSHCSLHYIIESFYTHKTDNNRPPAISPSSYGPSSTNSPHSQSA